MDAAPETAPERLATSEQRYGFQVLHGAPCIVPYVEGYRPSSRWIEGSQAIARRRGVVVETVYCQKWRLKRPVIDASGRRRTHGAWILVRRARYEHRTKGGLAMPLDPAWVFDGDLVHVFEFYPFELEHHEADIAEGLRQLDAFNSWGTGGLIRSEQAMTEEAVDLAVRSERARQAVVHAARADAVRSGMTALAEVIGSTSTRAADMALGTRADLGPAINEVAAKESVTRGREVKYAEERHALEEKYRQTRRAE